MKKYIIGAFACILGMASVANAQTVVYQQPVGQVVYAQPPVGYVVQQQPTYIVQQPTYIVQQQQPYYSAPLVSIGFPFVFGFHGGRGRW